MALTRFVSRRTVASLSKLSSYTFSYRCVATITTSTPFSDPMQATHASSSSHRTTMPVDGKHCNRHVHTSAQKDELNNSSSDSQGESEIDATMNEFLSRFVWIMRKKLSEAYPGCGKTTIDGMLVVIVDKVVLEMEKGGPEKLIGAAATMPSEDFSEDLWRTVWEVSNEVLQDMAKEKKKEKMKGYLQSEEVKEMYRFAGEVGIRGDMLRELRFKWAREKMEESEFYHSLESLCKEEAQTNTTKDEKLTKKEETEIGEEAVEDGNKQKSVSLPKRHGNVKYKIYGLNLSDAKWTEVADKIHESGKVMWPEEPKAISGKCKLVTEKIVSLKEEDDSAPLLGEWKVLLQPSRIEWIALLNRLKEQSPHLYFKIAEQVLDEVSFQTNVHDYSRLIDAYARQNHFEDAKRILKKMNENGISPDVVTLISIIHMYCKSGNFPKAKEIFESLKLHGLEPDMKVYDSMIMASANAGEPFLGEELVREMERRDMKPAKEIYMALVRSFSQRGDAQAVNRISMGMQFAGFQHTLESYTLMIEAYVQAGDTNQARLNFDHMIKSGHKPDDRCVASMISSYGENNELDAALNLLLKLEKDGFDPGVATYTNLVDWFAKMELVDEAEQMLDKIAKLGDVPPLKLHVSLCDMYSKTGSEKKALQALGVLESKSEQLGQKEFERVIESLAAGGFTQDAKKMQELMKARGFKASEKLMMDLMASQAFRKGNLWKKSRFVRNKS